MTQWATAVGVDTERCQFVDVWGLDSDALSFIPRPCFALVGVGPGEGWVRCHLQARLKGQRKQHTSADALAEISTEQRALGQSMLYCTQHTSSGEACGTFVRAHI